MSSFVESYNKEVFAVPIGGTSRTSVKINGVDLLEYGFMLTAHPGLLFPEVRTRYYNRNRRQGSRDPGRNYGNFGFSLVGAISGLTHSDMQSRLDDLKQFLDTLQHRQFDYVISSQSITALMFELTGHYHWYQEGNISGTNGNRILTGGPTANDTLWTKFIVPGARLEIVEQDPETVYTVTNVVSDELIEISPALQTSVANDVYRVETRRYLLVNIAGGASIEPIAPMGFMKQSKLVSALTLSQTTHSSNIYNISIPFFTAYPFWVSDPIVLKQTSLSSQSFVEVPNIGTSPSNPVYRVVGTVSNPKITACESSFVSNFECTVTGSTLRQDETVVGVSENQLGFASGVIDEGIEVVSGATFNFNSMADDSTPGLTYSDRLDLRQGSIVWLLKPDFASSDTSTRFLLDAGSFELKWNGSSTQFEVTDGTNTATVGATFSANDNIVVGCSWSGASSPDVDNSGNALTIWFNATLGTSAASYTATNVGQIVYLGMDSSAANVFTGIMDELAIYDYHIRPDLLSSTITDIYNGGTIQPPTLVLNQVPLTHANFDNNSQDTSTNIASTREFTTKTTAIGVGSVTLTGGGTNFVDNQPIVLYDDTGYTRNGFVEGTPTATSVPLDDGTGTDITNLDRLGISAGLNGSTQRFDGGDIFNLGAGDFVFGCWVKTSSSARQTVCARSTGEGNPGYICFINTSGQPSLYIRSTAPTTASINSTTAINDGKWHYVLWWINRDLVNGTHIFVDFERQDFDITALDTESCSNAENFTIGAESGGGNEFDGSLRIARMYMDGTIEFLAGVGADYGDLADITSSNMFEAVDLGFTTRSEDGLWLFTDALASNLGTDTSGNGNTLTPTGSPTRNDDQAFLSTNLASDPRHDLGSFGSYVMVPSANHAIVLSTAQEFIGDAVLFMDSGAFSISSSFYMAKKFLATKGSTYRCSFFHNNTGASQPTDTPGISIRDVTLGTDIRLSTGAGSDDLAPGTGEGGKWERFDTVFEVDNSGADIHEIEFRLAGTNDNQHKYIDGWLIGESFLTDGDCEAITGWTEVGTNNTFTVDGDEHSDALAIIFDAITTGSGITHTIQSLSTNSWYEFTTYSHVDDATPVPTLDMDLTGYSDFIGSVSVSQAQRLDGKAGRDYDKLTLIGRTLTDVTGSFQLTASDADSLATNFFIDDVVVAKRYGFNMNTGSSLSTQTYDITCHGKGVVIGSSGPGIAFPGANFIGRAEKFGAVMRFIPNFNADTASPDDKYLFTLHDGSGGPDNAFKVFYDVSADTLVFNIKSGGSDNLTLITNTMNFDAGNPMEVSVWYDSDGRRDPKDGTVYYAKILVNGEIRGTLTSAPTVPTSAPDVLVMGANLISSIQSGFLDAVVDGLKLFLYAPTDEELMKIYTQSLPLETHNVTMTMTADLEANDILTIDTQSGETFTYDASTGSIIREEKDVEGLSPSFLSRNMDQKQLLFVEADGTIPEFYIIYRNHSR